MNQDQNLLDALETKSKIITYLESEMNQLKAKIRSLEDQLSKQTRVVNSGYSTSPREIDSAGYERYKKMKEDDENLFRGNSHLNIGQEVRGI